MNKKYLFTILPCTLLASIYLITSASSTNFQFNDLITEKESKLLEATDEVIIESNEFEITNSEFIEFKENLKITNELNKTDITYSDTEILNELIKNELTDSYIESQNIYVSDEEVLEYANQTKEAFENSSVPELRDLHLALAAELDVAPEDYFTHPTILEEYRKIVAGEKLTEEMFEEGILTDAFSAEDFIENLYDESEPYLEINQSLYK